MSAGRKSATSALLGLVFLLGTACQQAERTAPPPVAGEAAATADFRLPRLSGEGELGPPDFAGKAVVVDFWATWCLPCRAQAQVLEAVHEQVSPEDVQFLAVDIGEGEKLVREFVAENPFPYPVLLDEDGELMVRLGLVALPTLMVVNTNGEVSYLQAGIIGADRLRELLAEAGVPMAPGEAATATAPAG